MDAPAPTNKVTTSRCPLSAAYLRAVQPPLYEQSIDDNDISLENNQDNGNFVYFFSFSFFVLFVYSLYIVRLYMYTYTYTY